MRQCLASVLRSSYEKLETVVADNGSRDGSQEMVLKEYPTVKLIEYKKNLGFCEGNNAAICIANGELIFLLNNDAIVDEHCIKELVSVCQSDKKIGMAGSKIYYLGEEKKTIKRLQYAGGKIFPSGGTENIGDGENDLGQYDEVRDTDIVCGASFMVKREVIELVGLLDPIYFMYYDDTDWSYRIRRNNFRVVYVPRAITYHHLGGSSFTANRLTHNTKNRLIFVFKNFPYPGLLPWFFWELRIALGGVIRSIYHKKNPLEFLEFLINGYIQFLRIFPKVWQKRISERFLNHSRHLSILIKRMK